MIVGSVKSHARDAIQMTLAAVAGRYSERVYFVTKL
jgi:hypothetical protein